MVEKGNLLDLKMLDIAHEDSTAPPVPTEGASSSEPRAKEPISLPAPDKLPASEPEEAAYSKELAPVWKRRPAAPPGFTLLWVDESDSSLLEDTASPVSIPLGAWLYLSSLETLHVIVCHITMMGEVQYQYQSMVASRTSLQLDHPKSSDHPDSP